MSGTRCIAPALLAVLIGGGGCGEGGAPAPTGTTATETVAATSVPGPTPRRATVPPGRVKVGQRVTVRLYIKAHRAPLEAKVALAPVARGEAATVDPANLYLQQIGCKRSDR